MNDIENGRKLFDMLQANCSETVQLTDAELAERVAIESEMFGPTDAESIRQTARAVQDDLDRQGREAFAVEYANTEALNL